MVWVQHLQMPITCRVWHRPVPDPIIAEHDRHVLHTFFYFVVTTVTLNKFAWSPHVGVLPQVKWANNDLYDILTRCQHEHIGTTSFRVVLSCFYVCMTEFRVCPYWIEVPAYANCPLLKPLIRLGYKDCDFITASKDSTLAFYGAIKQWVLL